MSYCRSRWIALFFCFFSWSLSGLVAFRVGSEVRNPQEQKVISDAVKEATKLRPILVIEDDEVYKMRPRPSKTLKPLQETLHTRSSIPTVTNSTKRHIPHPITEYWYNEKIHTIGNAGFLGGLHAAVAPLATRMIDNSAYEGVDARLLVARKLRDAVNKPMARILDMCSGVGMSTRALRASFPDAETVIGLDTSPQMIGMAKAISRHDHAMGKTLSLLQRIWQVFTLHKNESVNDNLSGPGGETEYVRGNAERTRFPGESFDLVTFMYAFHEVPRHGRYLMMREARRLLQDGGTLAVLDISPTYQPSKGMLAGEPFVIEYQKHIQNQMNSMPGFADVECTTIVPGHLNLWTLKRKSTHAG